MLNYIPEKVAFFEVQAWKAHHHGQKVRLIYFLLRHHMELFSIHSWQAIKALKLLVPAIRAHNFSKKVEAEELLVTYYSKIKKYTGYSFDPKLVASKEAAWWWIHDDLEYNLEKTPLVQAMTQLYAAILSVPTSATEECGKLRTQATIFHDLAESKKTPEAQVGDYWKKTELELKKFYTELLRVDRERNGP